MGMHAAEGGTPSQKHRENPQPADEVGGTEGMVALSLVSDDFPALTRAIDAARVKVLRGTGEMTVETASSHGVHLHISRYE